MQLLLLIISLDLMLKVYINIPSKNLMFVLVNLLGEKYPIICKHLGCGVPNSNYVNLVWNLNKSFYGF